MSLVNISGELNQPGILKYWNVLYAKKRMLIIPATIADHVKKIVDFFMIRILIGYSSSLIKKISSTDLLKNFASFSAKYVDGINFPFSIEWIDCLVTPISFAKSSCDISLWSNRQRFRLFPNFICKIYCNKCTV